MAIGIIQSCTWSGSSKCSPLSQELQGSGLQTEVHALPSSRGCDKDRFKEISFLSSYAVWECTCEKMSCRFHCPPPFHNYSLPEIAERHTALSSGTLLWCISPARKISQAPNKTLSHLRAVCYTCFFYIFLFHVKQDLGNRCLDSTGMFLIQIYCGLGT